MQQAVQDGRIKCFNLLEGPADGEQDLYLWTRELEDIVREIMEDPVFKGNQNFSFELDVDAAGQRMFGGGRFIKHKIPVKPIYVTVCNLNLVVSGNACACRVLGMMPSLKKSATFAQTDSWRRDRRLRASDCIILVSATL